MSLDRFLLDLAGSGRVRVPRTSPGIDPPADAALATLDRRAREEFPGEAPTFSPTAARWAALRLEAACRFLVHRDLDEAAVRDGFSGGAPRPDPSTVWSVDLTFRFLPGVLRLARGLSEADPLVECLRGLAFDWPLSSVGVPALGPVEPGAWLDHPGLARLYADRILAARDASRLDDPRAAGAVREAVGAFPELAGSLVGALGLGTAA